ncbi:hypothetical protein LTR86_000049 [Recurvomyces mirabilis]|nr:hypothetical protein LTR86_000049 [Recurvomyces mirabilis]
MPESTSFFIVAANGGMVAQKTPGGIYNKIADHTNTAQRWTLEYGDEAGTKVAFQNVSNGQWLRASSGAAAGKVDLGDKQWWTLEQGRAPGSCWIKCDDYPDAFLCNSYANHTDNNLAYMWPKQLNWTHSMLWYFQDADAPGWTPKSYDAGVSANASANSADAETLKQREADLKQKEEAVAAREEEQKQLEQKAAELKQKEQDISAREAALKKEVEQLDAKKKDSTKTQPAPSSSSDDDNRLQSKIDDISAREKQLAVKQASSTKKGLQLNAQEEELQRREKDLAAKMQAFNTRETPTKGGTESADAESLLIAENRNLKLQIQLQELEQRLTEAEKAVKQAHQAGNTAPSVNVTHMEQLEKENARLKDLLALQEQLEQSRPSPAQTERLKKEHERLKSLIAQQVQHRKLSSHGIPPKDADKGSQSVDAGPSKPQANGSISKPATEPSNKPLARPAATANMGTRVSKAKLPTATGEPTVEPSEQEKLREENARLKSEMQSLRQPTESNAPSSVGKVASNGHAGSSKAPAASSSGATKPKQHSESQHPPSGAGHQRLPTTQANGASKARGPQKSTGKPNTSRPEKQNGKVPSKSATPGTPRAPAARQGEDTGDIHKEDDDDADDGVHFSCGHVAYPAPRKIRRKMLGILYE